MRRKIIDHNLHRLSIVVTYQDEQLLASVITVSGLAILILTYLGVTPKVLASFLQTSDDVFIFCYIVGLFVLFYGLLRVYRSFLVSQLILDKAGNRLEVERKYFTSPNKQVFRLSEATGVEILSKKANSELVLSLKIGNQYRGEKITFAKGSIITLHILWREIFEFLKDQPCLILNKQWLIERNENQFKLYRSPVEEKYTIDRKAGYLICELDGKEVGRYSIQGIKNVETEINPDKSDDEISDHIVLTMIDGGKIPISSYQYKYDYDYDACHELIVRALKYALRLETWLHIAPDFYEFFPPHS